MAGVINLLLSRYLFPWLILNAKCKYVWFAYTFWRSILMEDVVGADTVKKPD